MLNKHYLLFPLSLDFSVLSGKEVANVIHKSLPSFTFSLFEDLNHENHRISRTTVLRSAY